ncbi:tail fiber domain-containing protein (plasmid) [Klebsiella pneumoniae]|uniref:tail fiber domain-containing protein n=1 Tax=Klebsiella pneumoniae TaxID=573 RepID=UPI000D83A4F6|nr:tail fiber domain-containing protein [Klebsiella pneumoniae]HDS3617147.1 tail fiber domain-containing protein [Klebsiella pneumoniae subsp. pneumoniae]ELA2691399.1 tail fiber domain-containing protein [Klebsiella pneumoniae]MBD7018370.1 tail fiber domain-containing protein [Klebsiella pneumoniae]MBR7492292.1 tail fiber domain-containing protein [Klebsiella pneumoniae]MDG0547495.1 tail fiber domain-containing protein [Klebsiella pneumoniae]
MAMYEVGTITGAANQAKVTGISTKWSESALGIQEGSILVVYRSGSADLYAIKSVNNDTQLTLTRNITTAFSGAKYGIITSETASTSSFANQLASAFTLWRNVVQGWSTALTGSGNITMTDPITGTQVTVPAIAGMAKASDLDALAKLSGGNNLAGSQIITSDSSGFILGRNNDIGLVKKSGTYGKLMVGSGTRFSVVKGNKSTISPEDTQTEIMGVDSAGNMTVPGNISAGKYFAQAIELSMSTPYIDFHFNGSIADFTARIIQDRQNRLNIQGNASLLVTDGNLTAGSTMPGNIPVGQQVTAAPVRSQMLGRGAYGDPDGAYVQMYMEEKVGTEHRIVLYSDGFGRTDAWLFRPGGTITTGKGDVMTTGSDVRLKDGFTEPQEGASRRINALGVCEFNMKGETRRRRGFIAQQAEKVDPIYTFQSGDVEIDGEKINILNVDQTAIVADLVTTVQEQCNCIEKLKEELKNLKDLVMQTPETAA